MLNKISGRRLRLLRAMPGIVCALVPAVLFLPSHTGTRLPDFVRGSLVGVLLGLSILSIILFKKDGQSSCQRDQSAQ